MNHLFSLYNFFFLDWSVTNHVLQNKGKEKEVIVEGMSISSWKPPREGFVKLNTDGAWKSSDIAGGGGMFRSTTGSWFVGFTRKYNMHSSMVAELYATRDELIMAKDYHFDKVELEIDALSLKIMLDVVEKHSHHELAPFLRDVAQLMQILCVKVVRNRV
ncbi:uncharacterized protein [Spinacia oleracea]|uniref:RNase H type-1 domain-containing protein n=1 Tax=Spinacia oleracea TaxID=3562 RepID=A0A9R0J2W6_SPIOL|nr:uncharacterized protein LOC110799413 [Spinacia oleracea]